MNRLDTIKYQGKDYATVPARLKEFRQTNPRAAIETSPTHHEDGSVTFKATITQDRKDDFSAVATGNAHYSAEELKKPKAFEKLETISVGRALANLGYLNDGQIATSEEMLEFEQHRLNKVEEAIEAIGKAEKRGDFEEILTKLNPDQQREIAPVIKARMLELKNAVANK